MILFENAIMTLGGDVHMMSRCLTHPIDSVMDLTDVFKSSSGDDGNSWSVRSHGTQGAHMMNRNAITARVRGTTNRIRLVRKHSGVS